MNLTFSPSVSRMCAPIPIIDDLILEQTETFFVIASERDLDVGIDPSMAIVNIQDNDGVYWLKIL